MMKCHIIQNGYSVMPSLCIKYGKRHLALLTLPSAFLMPTRLPSLAHCSPLLPPANRQYANKPADGSVKIKLIW